MVILFVPKRNLNAPCTGDVYNCFSQMPLPGLSLRSSITFRYFGLSELPQYMAVVQVVVWALYST